MPSSILNSDDGVISGTAGLKNSGGDDGVLVFQSKGTDTAKLETNGDFAINAGFGSVGKAYLCRAWVNFNGTGTVAIRASGNVSSITDNGTGAYTVNFTTAMPDVNYCTVVSVGGTSSANFTAWGKLNSGTPVATGSVAVTAIGMGTGGSTYTANDQSEVSVAIFR